MPKARAPTPIEAICSSARWYSCLVKRFGLAVVFLAATLGCGPSAEAPPPADLGTFPYHPLVFHVDLAILAYQLHAQSLVWPVDPFYEEGPAMARDGLMTQVHEWAARRGPAQLSSGRVLDVYRGPGSLMGLEANRSHNPILFNYARLHPWSDALMNGYRTWTEYRTPRALTGRIREVYVSARRPGSDALVLTPVSPGREDWVAGAADVLLAFEGGTGAKGIEGQPPSFSLMGFVLLRDTGAGTYDVHISFRGSRSGEVTRAGTQALDTDAAAGNPDWITNLGWDKLDAAAGAGAITTVGGVSRGMATSMTSILPALELCLRKVAELRPGVAPTHLFVTGHSLGAGLAQHFVSAVLLGNQWGPRGAGPAMPAALRRWPWDRLKLITISGPRSGDYAWARALSRDALDAQFFDPGPVPTVDGNALVAIDPNIVTRLHDASRPAAFRVLISTDPITTTRFGGEGNHVGTTVYVNGRSFIDWVGVVSGSDHEPAKVRQYLLDGLQDERTPKVAWTNFTLEALSPDFLAAQRGTPPELEKLAAGLRRRYAEQGVWFDDAAFSRDLALRFAIERGEAN